MQLPSFASNMSKVPPALFWSWHSSGSTMRSSSFTKYGVSMRRGSFYQAPWEAEVEEDEEGSGEYRDGRDRYGDSDRYVHGRSGDNGGDDEVEETPPALPPREADESEDEERENYERAVAEAQAEVRKRGGHPSP